MQYKQARMDLLEMLRTKRPAGTTTEREWCKKWLEPLGCVVDGAGNYMTEVRNPDGSASDIMWSSHTDTVHWSGGRQTLHVDDKDVVHLSKRSKKDGECLGADCTTGVWIMREMYFANVPGLYVWHYGEEKGCIGSTYIRKNTPEILKDINYCIAFDRFGTDSVITHQSGTRTASDAFAMSFADATGLHFEADPGGSYTDSNEYKDHVSECSNISVGYYAQHSSKEVQCLTTAMILVEAMCSINVSKLVCARDPNAYESAWDTYDYGTPYTVTSGASNYDQLLAFVRDHPHEAADLLDQWGANELDIQSQLGFPMTMTREYDV